MEIIQKPQAGEYPPYTIEYLDLVPDDGLLIQHLTEQMEDLVELVGDLSDEEVSTPCAPGEWTIKEILVHISDTERIFAYRALRLARNDTTELAGFEQDDYVANSGANERDLESILAELAVVRAASITLVSSFSAEAFNRRGVANGHPLSVRAVAYLMSGHELHHVKSIKENYLQV